MPAKLIAHRRAVKVSREELQQIVTPPATESWKPVPHVELVNALTAESTAKGMTITREEIIYDIFRKKIVSLKLFPPFPYQWWSCGRRRAVLCHGLGLASV
jgi:hypothetical protein